MSLMDKAINIMAGFNPATDSVSNFEEIKDGTYDCVIEEIIAKVSENTGNEYLTIKFSVVGEECNGRLIYVNKYVTEKTESRTIKECLKLMHDYGYKLPPEAFEDVNTLAETMSTSIAGCMATVKKSTSKNDYVNYTIMAVIY